jgi:hypothetical protein
MTLSAASSSLSEGPCGRSADGDCDQTRYQADRDIQNADPESSAGEVGPDLPLKCRERRECGDESTRDEKPPRGVHGGVVVEIFEDQADEETCADVDGQRPYREAGTETLRGGRADEISQHRAERSPEGDEQIALQWRAPFNGQ